MNSPKEIGEYIARLRKAKNLTQAEVAERIGIRPNTYTQFEAGRTNMTLNTLNKIANALGYDIAVVFNLKA